MSNYIEYNDGIIVHPGYYLEEMIEEKFFTKKDFAKNLGMSSKNFSALINGKQDITKEIADKLSKMLGTTTDFWINLQRDYDEAMAIRKREKEVFDSINYKYFNNYFGLPNLPRKTYEQLEHLREFLAVSSLIVLKERDFAVNFRSYSENLTQSNIVNANVMVQIAINKAMKVDAPKFNKDKFIEAVDFALTQTENHNGFFPAIKEVFRRAGVILIALPNLSSSGINGATKKIGDKILLMVNDRRNFADTFWFSLFHEIGHIMNGDYGISFADNKSETENDADLYAQNMLIPKEQYQIFVSTTENFNEETIKAFAKSINRDPGIVLGRLQNDKKISYNNIRLERNLRKRYKVLI